MRFTIFILFVILIIIESFAAVKLLDFVVTEMSAVVIILLTLGQYYLLSKYCKYRKGNDNGEARETGHIRPSGSTSFGEEHVGGRDD